MIPKIIHYCWFGNGEMPELAYKCIESWKKYCPDYEIKLWNENNIDVTSVPYMKEAYEAQAWGFVPDVARLQIIYNEGGVYLDTDVELIRSLEPLLNEKAFMGLEDGNRIALGLGFGAEPHNNVIKRTLDVYSTLHYKNADGSFNRISSPTIQTQLMKTMGFVQQNHKQIIEDCMIYPQDFFCPYSYNTGKKKITNNTFSIHHYDGAWLTKEEKVWDQRRYAIMRKYGNGIGNVIWCFYRFNRKIKTYGIKETIRIMKERIIK